MDVALVQPRLLAFIAMEFGAVGGHPGALQSGHKVTYKVTSTKEAASRDPREFPKTASDTRFYRLR